MSQLQYEAFFSRATGNTPYDYQCRLAGSDSGIVCQSQLINVPTGLGKTAAVVLAWLWNRVGCPDLKHRDQWPRRLVYCLPMRTLVEQTEAEVKKWLTAQELLWDDTPANRAGKVGIHILMGGEDAGEWDIYPEENAILIGTQDMLLSRALNRGYGMSRARWPMHFGLLNNDCLWVLDETQLMGVGVRTSAQLAGLRKKIGVAADCATWWASATLDKRLLDTPDHREQDGTLALAPADHENAEVDRRINAVKHLAPLPLTLAADSTKIIGPYLDKLAINIIERHQPKSVTIIILNRVDRAKDLLGALEKTAKKQSLPECVLVHSRFRLMEREKLSVKIKEPGEKIIIATQAIEAGVDISSRTLFTELAPWSSLVQRFGRCNRKGEFNETGGSHIFWINLEAADEKNAAALALPYTEEQLTTARQLLRLVEPAGASPAALEKIHADERLAESHILRRKDLIDLFDTTPDLAGLDIDVGRYIRDDEGRDVQIFWRKISDAEKLEDIEPLRKELVSVSLGGFSKFFKENKAGIWHWNALDGEWQHSDRPAPGQTYLLNYELGGYSEKLGWTGEKSKMPFDVLSIEDQPKRLLPRDGQGLDDESLAKAFLSIEEHTDHVIGSCQKIMAVLPASASWSKVLLLAARWHDVGKAHAYFQSFLTKNQKEIPEKFRDLFLAKTPRTSKQGHNAGGRPHFRHELASALAWLQVGEREDSFNHNLVAYLIAAHHGKVRLSIRSMPGEKMPTGDSPNEVLFARGIWHGEKLPAENNGKKLAIDGFPNDPITLDLSCMKIGELNGHPSWSTRVLSLRDHPQLGVFRLAWLETLLRAADGCASALETKTDGFDG